MKKLLVACLVVQIVGFGGVWYLLSEARTAAENADYAASNALDQVKNVSHQLNRIESEVDDIQAKTHY